MAFNRKHINLSGEFNTLQKGVLIKSFEEVAAGTVVPQAAPAALTNSTGGTADNTVAAVGNTTTDQSTVINNNFADLAVKINAIRTALIAAGVMS